jgi:hypothetical protein
MNDNPKTISKAAQNQRNQFNHDNLRRRAKLNSYEKCYYCCVYLVFIPSGCPLPRSYVGGLSDSRQKSDSQHRTSTPQPAAGRYKN